MIRRATHLLLTRRDLLAVGTLSILVGMLLAAVTLGDGRNVVVCTVSIFGVLFAAARPAVRR